MKLPTQKKVLLEDLKGAPAWIRPLVGVINSFMETVYQAMNKNITHAENIASQIREVTYKTPSTYPTGAEQITFNSSLKTKAIGCLIWQAYDKATYIPVETKNPAWIEDNGVITISPITGLTADTTYTIRFIVY